MSKLPELQIGIAPTQMHTFDLPPHSSHEHSEYFLTMDGLKSPDRLYSDDYADAIDEISNYLNSSPHGVDHAVWAEMQASMTAVAEQPISTSDILFNGSAWGALHAKLSGVSNPQSVLYFEEPTTSYIPEDLTPWKELVNDGTFSKASLERTPSSFVAGAHPKWAEGGGG